MFTTILIIVVVAFLAGLSIQLVFSDRLRKLFPSKPQAKAIDPAFKTIKEVFDTKLEPPPLGCLWEVEKTENIYVGKEIYAKIKLITSNGTYRVYENIPLPKGNIGLPDLAKRVSVASRKIVNAYNVEYGNWDGVYMKDVL